MENHDFKTSVPSGSQTWLAGKSPNYCNWRFYVTWTTIDIFFWTPCLIARGDVHLRSIRSIFHPGMMIPLDFQILPVFHSFFFFHFFHQKNSNLSKLHDFVTRASSPEKNVHGWKSGANSAKILREKRVGKAVIREKPLVGGLVSW